jgi:hypothetical protein
MNSGNLRAYEGSAVQYLHSRHTGSMSKHSSALMGWAGGGQP